MSTYTHSYAETMEELSCWCGIPFSAPASLYRAHHERKAPGHLYCPLGHQVVYGGETEAERERQRRIHAEASLAREQDRHESTRKSLAATKGHLTRIRNRVAHGVCPWCKRSVKQMRDHVATKHPEHVGQLAEAMGE
jgi:hypothetical protein